MAKRFTVPRAEAGGMSAQRIKPAVGTSAIRGDALPTPNIDVGRSSFSFVPAKTMTDLGDTLAGVLASADANDTALALQERKIRIQVGSQELQKDLITSSNEAFEEATKIGGPTSETAGRRNFDPSNIDKVAGEWEQRQIDAYYKKFKDDQVFIDNTQGDFFKSLELGKVNITKKTTISESEKRHILNIMKLLIHENVNINNLSIKKDKLNKVIATYTQFKPINESSKTKVINGVLNVLAKQK